MSDLAWIELAARSVLTLPGVKCCFAVSEGGEHFPMGTGDVSHASIAAATALARQLLSSSEERFSDESFGYRIAARKIRESTLCVFADPSKATDAELHRKLNVVAIRAQVNAAKQPKEPLNPFVFELRDAFIAEAGPLSALVFDRALEQLQTTHRLRDQGAVREVIAQLAMNITPPGNHRFNARAKLIFEDAEARSEIDPIRESRRPMPSSSSFPATRPSSSNPPAMASAPPRPTVPYLGALVDVAREVVGPFGDFLVQRALREIDRVPQTGDAHADGDAVIARIATELPPEKRARFIAESRAALRIVAPPSSPNLTPPGRRA